MVKCYGKNIEQGEEDWEFWEKGHNLKWGVQCMIEKVTFE